MKTNTTLALTIISFLLISCSKPIQSVIVQDEILGFEETFEKIELGISATEVASMLGQPMDIQYNGSSFAWQYCRNLQNDNKYYVVSFNGFKVSDLNNYYINNSHFEKCERCIMCFDEIELKSQYSIDGESNQRMEKKYKFTKTDINAELNTIGKIVLANYFPGLKAPVFKFDMSSIQAIVNLINDQPESTFILIGHTGSQGGKKANVELSEERAKSMKSILIRDFGLKSEKITTGGGGEMNPVSENNSTFGRSMNRRVELSLNNGEF